MPREMMLLQGATLIDGTGGPAIDNAAVLLDGNRIAYAGPSGGQFDDLQARRFDLSGKTLIPGLIEAHTHAAFDSDMIAYLKNGITAIRFAGLNQDDVVKLRSRIESRELPGPRIFSCGRMIDQSPPAYPEWSVSVDSPREAAAATERQIVDDGVDAVIVTQRVTAPVMREVIAVAHALGRSVIGQTWTVDGQRAAELGIDELHNSSRVFVSRDYSTETLLKYTSIANRLALSGHAWATIDWDATRPIMDAMISYGVKYCGLHVITQFQAGEGVAELAADPDFMKLFGEDERVAFRAFTERLQGSWTKIDLDCWRIANDNRMEWMRRFRELGGSLLVGTDMQFGGIMYHRELRNLAEIGFSPAQIIAAATGDCAKAMHLDATLGTIQAGRLADIVVLNRDPLQDLGALRDVSCVIKDGLIAWGNGQDLLRAQS